MLTPELQAILDEANARGTLVDGHPEITPKSREIQPPRFVQTRYVADKHEPLSEKNWRTWTAEKTVEHAGNSGIQDPVYRARMGWDQ
jgi:hypothetical protein